MPHHHEQRILPHSAAQMFDLVADVKSYPEFLPWVSAIRIRKNDEQEMLADMVVGFKSLRETFSSRVVKTPKSSIVVDYLDGPMKHLHNAWQFADLPEGGSSVDFTVDFSFRNRVFEALAGQFFDSALRKMTSAFIERADNLYGAGGSSNPSA
ncbi:type II toxin-antitoxin system RatA family toxin [Sphingorhabdus lacus]|jgi:coenzyme Q-binding protein COQ10|uniref:Type II toxin-antitoxin system RatA family toxin n=1 Tax=Sphingorhabdus lacus TaxID=392610 RepID=A0A6I6LC02_9SPHN|nr:type II toxin-antitoxin system RatA family toxin [Sphingorhabdus lacus]QGY79803.1 type II toxin-antitoxin system RatA family toxin [Sphingorhabdus lacus]HPV69292.1 type II toxin-antitoxin system RatA family toxin [Sphingorhabdus lacus]